MGANRACPVLIFTQVKIPFPRFLRASEVVGAATESESSAVNTRKMRAARVVTPRRDSPSARALVLRLATDVEYTTPLLRCPEMFQKWNMRSGVGHA